MGDNLKKEKLSLDGNLKIGIPGSKNEDPSLLFLVEEPVLSFTSSFGSKSDSVSATF